MLISDYCIVCVAVYSWLEETLSIGKLRIQFSRHNILLSSINPKTISNIIVSREIQGLFHACLKVCLKSWDSVGPSTHCFWEYFCFVITLVLAQIEEEDEIAALRSEFQLACFSSIDLRILDED